MYNSYLSRLFLTLLAAAYCASAEVHPDSSYYFRITNADFKNYIGYTSGVIIGDGFAYRRWFANNTALQFNTNAIARRYLNIGLTGIQSLKKYGPFRVVGYVSTKLVRADKDGYVASCVGVGIEYYIGRLASSMMLGLSTIPGTNGSSYSSTHEIGMYIRF